MKISFTGSQRGMNGHQLYVLWYRLKELRPAAFIHGACIGADDEADEIAFQLGIQRVIFPSDRLDKSALDKCEARGGFLIIAAERMHPLKRNPLIVKAGDRLIACPNQPNEIPRSGTWTTVRHGRKILGREHVEIIRP